ncbi:MAG: 2-phospho-L-lactate guanylyltransferase [Chloroflexota bacterium]|nr:2-phospho-L-lactate guanylyltransferase [Chloroflexota bacterium]
MSRPTADLSSLHVVVPVHDLANAKTRLGLALDAEERETLMLGLLRQVLTVLDAWPARRRTHVVSADRAVVEVARGRGAAVVPEPPNGDLNGALMAGRDRAVARGATAVLFLPADLPLISVTALDQLLDAADAALAAGRGRPVVVAAPADARGGTNALLLSPPDVIAPAFGTASLEAHVRSAQRADASVQLVAHPHLGFDLDTPDDLERLEEVVLLDLMRGALSV